MNQSKGSMGIAKHRKSGKAPKSPKARHRMKLDAERQKQKAKPSTCKASSMRELRGD